MQISISSPLTDAARIAAVRETALLDTPSEELFDRLTELTASTLGTGAMISLLDRTREYFLSTTDVPEPWARAREIPVSRSLCRFLVRTGEPLVVADARADERVADTPAVREDGILSYAGIPLRSPGGQVLGGFCALGTEPHSWTGEEVALLTRVADTIAREIEVRTALRRARRVAPAGGEVESASVLFRSLVEQSLAGIYLVREGHFVYANPRIAEIFGYAPDELLGRSIYELVAEEDHERVRESIRERLEGETESARYGFRGRRKDGSPVEVEVHGSGADVGGERLILGTLLDRTAEHRADERRRQREEHFRSLIENVWDVIHVVDAEGTIRYISPSVERLLGYRPEELVGKSAVELVHPEDVAAAGDTLEDALRRPGITRSLELRLLHRDGSVRLVETMGKGVSDPEGTPIAIVNTHDITDRKRADAALRESEERYRLVSRATSDMILDRSISTGELRWNGAGPRMLRYTMPEVGSTVEWYYERIHPEDREWVVREQESFLSGVGTSWSGEYRILRGDGRYATVLHRGHVTRDERGKPLRMLSSIMDVTERRRAEEAQRFLARASALLDSSLDYEATFASLARLAVPARADYCLVDLLEKDGTIRRVATAHADPTREHLLLRERVVPADADPGHHPVARVIRTGEPLLVPECDGPVLARIAPDEAHRRRLEELGLRSLMIVPLTGHDEPVGALTLATVDSTRTYQLGDLVVAEDLAHRVGLAVQHARLYREARQAVDDREDVLGFVSHDLRNPVHTIQMAATLLLETMKERRSDNRKWIQVIQRASDQMTSLIDDLVEVSRFQAGQFFLQGSRQDVSALVCKACELLEPLAASRSIRLECATGEAIPPVWMDPDQILRVISNLVGNAIKFTPEGGSIALRAERTGEEVRFSVSDTGPGISAEQLPHIFDRYWQARRGDRRGSGLGLAIAKGIVEAHGGRIRVESREGEGATFFFTIPAR